jgi:hypothetical protein
MGKSSKSFEYNKPRQEKYVSVCLGQHSKAEEWLYSVHEESEEEKMNQQIKDDREKATIAIEQFVKTVEYAQEFCHHTKVLESRMGNIMPRRFCTECGLSEQTNHKWAILTTEYIKPISNDEMNSAITEFHSFLPDV